MTSSLPNPPSPSSSIAKIRNHLPLKDDVICKRPQIIFLPYWETILSITVLQTLTDYSLSHLTPRNIQIRKKYLLKFTLKIEFELIQYQKWRSPDGPLSVVKNLVCPQVVLLVWGGIVGITEKVR